MENKKILKYGELFCGAGGLALGAIKSSLYDNGFSYEIQHQWASDYDKDACETYRNNIAKTDFGSVICDDVKSINIGSLGEIDIFAYGFPCNDFSIVGEQKGFDGDYGPLYRYGVKVLNFYRPKFFVAENVGGIISANDGEAFKKIFNDLSSSGNGYEITAHKYRAEDYGVPQTRHRVILVGVDKTLNKQFRVPAPTHLGDPVSCRQAIEFPPIAADAPNNEIKKETIKVKQRLAFINPGENVWSAKLPEDLKLNVKSAKMSQIYKRLHPDKPAYTITASGGGGTHGYHYAETRALTNRERARLQTFPDGFVFVGTTESVRKQIGMAVPPLLAKIIFESILKTYAGIKYDFTNANVSVNKQTKILWKEDKLLRQYQTDCV